jgi:hypothetical protein
MILNDTTLESLRDFINGKTEYRSGPELVKFFNSLGFNDTYYRGFPSRWQYTDEKLNQINGTPEIEKCIKMLFAPQKFIGDFKRLDQLINEFNQYLAFDGWKIIRDGKEIKFTEADQIDFSYPSEFDKDNEKLFLEKEFGEIHLEKLGLDDDITNILLLRIEEIKNCMTAHAPLAAIILLGSVLEGILLGIANQMPKEFNQSNSAPKNATNNAVKRFQEWSLANFIDVAYDLELINKDIKLYSQCLRDFRNYIHPYVQLTSKFIPNDETAKISFQVLKAAIFQLSKSINLIY